MAHIVLLGAGLGGAIMAYEMKDKIGPEDRITVINKGDIYSYVPSNPWVAVGWRSRDQVEVNLRPAMERRGITLRSEGAKRLHPAENRVELMDGTMIDYDYLIIATGPDLAFDEIAGLGPQGHTQSICVTDHAI